MGKKAQAQGADSKAALPAGGSGKRNSKDDANAKPSKNSKDDGVVKKKDDQHI